MFRSFSARSFITLQVVNVFFFASKKTNKRNYDKLKKTPRCAWQLVGPRKPREVPLESDILGDEMLILKARYLVPTTLAVV